MPKMPRNLKSKKQTAYEVLKRKIISNSLKPGEPLNERVLSDELGISKTPIREALQQLEKEGFIENISHKGAFVSRISGQDVREVFEIREILECAAAKHTALTSDLDRLSAIRKKFESIEREHGDTPLGLLKAGDQIHSYIFEEGFQNNRLSEIYERVQEQIGRFRTYFVNQFDQNRLEQASKEHKEILESLFAKDPSRAEDAMRTHLRNGMEYIKGLI